MTSALTMLGRTDDLGFVAFRIGGIGTSAIGQDVGTTVLNGAAIAAQLAWFARPDWLADQIEEATKGTKAPVAIIHVTQAIVLMMNLLYGFDSPDDGASFEDGADEYDDLIFHLENAFPDPRDWSGDAADAYTAQNIALLGLVEELAALDRQVKNLVAGHADEVARAHLTHSSLAFSLVMAEYTALCLFTIPVWGPAISYAFQSAMAMTSLGIVVDQLQRVSFSAREVSDAVEVLDAQYDSVAERAQKVDSSYTVYVPVSEQTSVGTFDTAMSGPSALTAQIAARAAAVPRAATSSAAANNVTDDAPGTGGSDDAPDGGGTGTEGPEGPEDGAPANPEAGTRVPGQFVNRAMTVSSRAAQVSADASQHMAVVEQVTGQVESVSDMAQGWQDAAATPEEPDEELLPAEETPAEEIPAEGIDAAAGPEAGQRAPVGDPADPSAEPTSVAL